MEWSNKGFKWIPLFCLLLLNEKVHAFSACQHPPQEILISRGQKITVVYWVGQNALEDGGFQDEASTLPSTEIPEIATTEAATLAPEENSTSPNDESLPSSESAPSTEDDEAISTDSNLQTIDARHADVTTEVLPVTSSEAPRIPTTTSEDNTLQEDLLKTTESDPSESPISGRNDTALDDESSTLSTVTLAETTSAGTTSETSDATAAQSEVVNVQFIATSTESQNGDDESSLGVSSRQLDPEVDDGTEVQYWSTTVVPEESEESSTTETLSEDPQVTGTLESTTVPADGDSEPSTTPLPEGLEGKSIDESATSSLDGSTVANGDDATPNLDGRSGSGNDDDESENSTTLLDGKSLETSTTSDIDEEAANTTVDSIDDDVSVVNSSESSSSSLLQVRASLVVEGTPSPLVPSTESNDTEDATGPTRTEGSSLLENIGTTLKNLLWTSVSESDVATAEVPKGRKSEEGPIQDLEGSTLAPSDDEQQKSNESIVAPEVVFPNTTADPEIMTIDPREQESDSGNSTDEETTGSGEQRNLSENVTEVSTTELDGTAKVEGQTVQGGSSTPLDQDGTEPVTPDADEDDEGEAESIGPVAIDPFQELPEVLVPLDNLPVHPTEAAAEEFISDVDRTPEKEGPRTGWPVDDFDPLASADTTGPVLIPLSDDDDVKTEDGTKPNKSSPPPAFLSLALEDVQQNPLGPPPIFLRYPDRGDNSFLNRHGFSVHDSPEVYIGDLQPAASSAYEPVYRNLYPSDQAMAPPESPVHYVSVLRSPDGVLPIQSLRTTPSKRKRLLQSRIKRSINETNCEWIFKSAPGVPLLLTFKSFSTPETTDCEDHYISVERESNGFQSRWCGVSKDRAGHASFARSEIRLRLFSKGDGSFPTGFSVEVQALDLKLLRKYAEVRRIIKHH